MYEQDTIGAISTALGEGAIGIVRLSGPEAVAIADQCFKGQDLGQVASHTLHYGHILDPESQEVVDEVMVSVMRAPRTYTREDVVEINCHGGVVSLQRTLDLVLAAGARLAEPGEFTQRAFLNGRIDLSQAEAVMDIIQAKTAKAHQASLQQLQGGLSAKIRQLRQSMLESLAQVEVSIDYPEYDDVEEMSLALLQDRAQEVKGQVQALLEGAQGGRIFREGIQTVIVGRPNVGKSSLLNRIAGSDKAIVTDISGTTRDTIEEYVNVRGIPLKLVDTAGIRQTQDQVEQIGVQRSRASMEAADLVVLVLNQAEPLQPVDCELLEATQDQRRIVLVNKSDLAPAFSLEDLPLDPEEVIPTSMTEDWGLDRLEDRIHDLFFAGALTSADMHYLLNSRHTRLLQEAVQALEEVEEACQAGLPVDLIQIDFTRAWDLLGEITGDSVPDELINQLFSQFCLGK